MTQTISIADKIWKYGMDIKKDGMLGFSEQDFNHPLFITLLKELKFLILLIKYGQKSFYLEYSELLFQELLNKEKGTFCHDLRH